MNPLKQKTIFNSAKASQKEDLTRVRFPSFILNAVAVTDTGYKRSANEDNYAMVVEHDPLTDKYHALFVAADGMGGHDFGEEASRTVCDTHLQTPQRDLAEIAKEAHKQIKVLEERGYYSSGSTEIALR